MTTITETRFAIPHGGGLPRSYQVQTPVHLASDTAFDAWFADQLREFLHRRGCDVTTMPDEMLLWKTAITFRDKRSRPAKGVESGYTR